MMNKHRRSKNWEEGVISTKWEGGVMSTKWEDGVMRNKWQRSNDKYKKGWKSNGVE